MSALTFWTFGPICRRSIRGATPALYHPGATRLNAVSVRVASGGPSWVGPPRPTWWGGTVQPTRINITSDKLSYPLVNWKMTPGPTESCPVVP